MRYWLMKTEPEVYSVEDLARDRTTWWEGVRNYQARNFMVRDMTIGDEVLIYHSNCDPPGVAGLAVVSQLAQPDQSAFTKRGPYFDPKSRPDSPTWFCVQVAFRKKFSNFLPLSTIKETAGLAKMPLVQRGQRRSVQPVTAAEMRLICDMVQE
jgi:predicted RNA-binding protein with PUA-like domain